ncbi:AAA family ATPase [Bernardetia sp. MNP-M8]|uniref:AAA family ATPase n=1 Tax=Bernardetia sp. MNP-M8 TaxID=3127470 RepID=UPI0030CAF4D0
MESELPKILEEKLNDYRLIVEKCEQILEETKNLSFNDIYEEVVFIHNKLNESQFDYELLLYMNVEIVAFAELMSKNPYNHFYNREKLYFVRWFQEFNSYEGRELDKTITKIEKNKITPISYSLLLDITTDIKQSIDDVVDLGKIWSRKNIPFKVFDNYQLLSESLKSVDIRIFQAIKKILFSVPIDAQFIAFTGENGDGKTSILQAIGLGLYNSDDLSDEDRGSEKVCISVQYQEGDKYYTNEIYNNPDYPTMYAVRHHMKELKSFAAYGTSRLRVSDKKEMQNPLLNLDPERAKLTNIFDSWLRDVSVNDKELFEKIKSIILEILPNVSEIKKKDETKVISDFLFIEKGIEVEFKHLSAGHKSIVLMIGDMIMRLSEAQPKEKNPSDFTGIVLIDEIEAHLHPKWQKEFPHILSTTFPKVQFIVTTHSAISLLGMPENTVFFRVQRSEEKGTYIERIDIDVKNLLPNAIYTSPLFDMESIRSTENKGIEELNVEDDFEEIIKKEENKKRLKELSKKFVFTPPKS